jgi:vancomycin permeability regulator SanA
MEWNEEQHSLKFTFGWVLLFVVLSAGAGVGAGGCWGGNRQGEVVVQKPRDVPDEVYKVLPANAYDVRALGNAYYEYRLNIGLSGGKKARVLRLLVHIKRIGDNIAPVVLEEEEVVLEGK